MPFVRLVCCVVFSFLKQIDDGGALTRLHGWIVKSNPVHDRRTAISLPVHWINFEVKCSIRIQSWQGERRSGWRNVKVKSPPFRRSCLKRFKEEWLRKSSIKASLANDFHWSWCSIDYATVFHGARRICRCIDQSSFSLDIHLWILKVQKKYIKQEERSAEGKAQDGSYVGNKSNNWLKCCAF